MINGEFGSEEICSECKSSGIETDKGNPLKGVLLELPPQPGIFQSFSERCKIICRSVLPLSSTMLCGLNPAFTRLKTCPAFPRAKCPVSSDRVCFTRGWQQFTVWE